MIAFAAIPLMAALNRFRGGGFGAPNLPGHPRYYVAPIVAALGAVLHGPWGALVGVTYLAWSFLPWGHLMCLGNYAPDREISWLEQKCLNIARGNYLLALALLHFVGLTPTFLLVSVYAYAMIIGIVAAYWAGWRFRPTAPIEPAEFIVGALWGVLIAIGM